MTKKHFSHFAKHFFYGTLSSRIFGMVRDVIMAFYFGSSPKIASFMVAYRLSNLFRRLFGEGTLNAGFVPYFESLQSSNKQKGYDFYRDLLFSLILILTCFIAGSELILTSVSSLIGPNEIVNYSMIMLPGLIFICLYALNAAFLNCHHKFFLPAVAPILFNIVWILSVLLTGNFSISDQIFYLSFGVVFGYFSQFLLTHFLSHKIYYRNIEKKRWYFPKLFSKDVKSMLRSLSYSIIGVGAVQINAAIDTIFAKVASSSGPAYLWYAIRIQQLPFALFSIAIASALLPTLSRNLQANQKNNFEKNFERGINLSFSLMFICTVGIFLIGAFVINLIYGRGNFTNISTIKTYQCLVSYSIGLVPQTFVLIIANCFYANKIYKTPAFMSVNTVVVNIALNTFFVFILKLEAFSVALATAISSIVNAFILTRCLKKIHPIRVFQKSFIKVVFVVLLAYVLTLIFGMVLFNDRTLFILVGKSQYLYPRDLISQILQFFSMTIVFFWSTILLSKIVKCNDILTLIKRTLSK